MMGPLQWSTCHVHENVYLEDPFGRNSCLFREERLLPSWGGNQRFARGHFPCALRFAVIVVSGRI